MAKTEPENGSAGDIFYRGGEKCTRNWRHEPHKPRQPCLFLPQLA